MVTITLHCPSCERESLRRHGHAPNGKQLYRCRACGRLCRENPTPHAYQERSSLCGLTRTDRGSLIPLCPVGSKKEAQLPPLCTTLLAPDPEDPTSTILELDELWSFMLKKAHDSWVWMALCRKTRQVVASAVGDRIKKTCQCLWEAIVEGYRQGHCFTDFLKVYASVIPEEQHFAVGKETGETAHVERWNNTLRKPLARFVRMTVSFSKSLIMHEACLLLFLHRSNTERAILLK